ncbi:MAG: cytochrome c family protein [Desulfobacterales bacterium]|nr:cytochrome c family protein [Desulfobacterales bacterium]
MKDRFLVLITISILLILCALFLSNVAIAEKKTVGAVYVGMEKCKDCHPEHVESYYSWKYSKNFRIIQMRKKDNDPNCLPCHTTGYGKQGGFDNVRETPGMINKQCESCHGPASLHLKAPTKREHQETLNIPKNVCTACHSGHKHPGY